MFLSFYLKTKALGRKLVRTKIIQHGIFYLGANLHMFWLIIEWVNVVFQLFYTIGLTWFYLQGSTWEVNIDPIKKIFKQKLFRIKFSKTKVSKSISLSTIGAELGRSKHLQCLKILEFILLLKPRSYTPMGDRDMLSVTCFFRKFILNNFCLKLFLIGSTFTPDVEPWR